MLRLAHEINSCRAIQSQRKNLSGWKHKIYTDTNIINFEIYDLLWLVMSRKTHDRLIHTAILYEKGPECRENHAR